MSKEYRDLVPPEEPENECLWCGNPCHNTYCSSFCAQADYDENCRER